jgi:methionyl-tRNA formyltransferase
MRIAFFGATELGHRCCEQLFDIGENVVGIFSIPEEFRISYSATPVKNVTYRGFEELAARHRVPLVYVTKKMGDSEYLETLRSWRADLGIAIGWYYMIPRSIRAAFPLGAAGIHASLLPKYRGGAPLVWAIINGERKSGVSFFYFEDGVDVGDLIAQKEFDIEDDDTIKTVYDKATQASLRVLSEYVPLLRQGKAPRVPQEGTSTQFPQRSPEDGLIDWKSKTAQQVHNWIRAQTRPYPGAFTYLGKEKVLIWKASVSGVQLKDVAPGSVITTCSEVAESFGVCCGDRQMLNIHEVGLADGSMLSGAEFIKARGIGPGARLGTG